MGRIKKVLNYTKVNSYKKNKYQRQCFLYQKERRLGKPDKKQAKTCKTNQGMYVIKDVITLNPGRKKRSEIADDISCKINCESYPQIHHNGL
jgi:hypothetical protein